MKKLFTRGLVAILVVCSVFAANASTTAKRDYTKVIKKDYDIDKDGEVWLVNQYGDVNITTTDKGKVKIKATITVYSNDEDKADEYLRRVYVKMTHSDVYFKAETIKESPKRKWYDWNTKGSNFSYRVDYEISIPKTVTLNISNRHGDLFIEEMYGRIKATVTHGNIKMEKANTSIDVMVAYGDAKFEQIGDGEINIKHGKLEIKQARDLKINSKNSRIFIESAADLNLITKNDNYEIGKMKDLRSNSKYDNFKIKEIQGVYANSRFSDYTIEKLEESGDFETEYTDVHIKSLDKSFNKIKFVGKQSDLIIDLNGTNTSLEIFSTQTKIDIPKGLRTKVDKEVNMEREIVGNIGGNADGLIKVTSQQGSITIKK